MESLELVAKCSSWTESICTASARTSVRVVGSDQKRTLVQTIQMLNQLDDARMFVSSMFDILHKFDTRMSAILFSHRSCICTPSWASSLQIGNKTY